MSRARRPPAARPWWQRAIVYQIYPRSFAEGDPDGRRHRLGPSAPTRSVGDLDGVRRHLDHLSWLGVSAIWLSPFYPSPMEDFGYDVSDYCDVDPLFGTLADFDGLVHAAHAKGIRVLVDWVPNHTSRMHPWFVESRSSRDAAKRDWYVWRDGSPERPPNNWRATFVDAPAWTWDEATRQWYLHLFLPSQPDLNWANPEVAAAMLDTMRFWLDRGVDGFRIDVAHALGKDPAYPDAEGPAAQFPWSAQNDHASTHAILRTLRTLMDSYEDDRVMVGEVFLLSTAKVATYYGEGDELHLSFNFPPLYAPWEAGAWRKRIRRVEEELGPRGAWPTWVLSNHDNPRHRTRYAGSEARARAAAVLLLTLRGTPFLYAGEELGLEDAPVDAEQALDPGGRDGCRAPIPWDPGAGHGWLSEPWLPFPPDADRRNVSASVQDPDSILHLYRRLIQARRASPALSLGTLELLEAPEGILAYRRSMGSERRVVLVNFTTAPVRLDGVDGHPAGSLVIEVSPDRAQDGTAWDGELRGDGALVLR